MACSEEIRTVYAHIVSDLQDFADILRYKEVEFRLICKRKVDCVLVRVKLRSTYTHNNVLSTKIKIRQQIELFQFEEFLTACRLFVSRIRRSASPEY